MACSIQTDAMWDSIGANRDRLAELIRDTEEEA